MWVEPRGAARHATVHRAVPGQHLAPDVNSSDAEQPWSGPSPQISKPFFLQYSKRPLEVRSGPHICLKIHSRQSQVPCMGATGNVMYSTVV